MLSDSPAETRSRRRGSVDVFGIPDGRLHMFDGGLNIAQSFFQVKDRILQAFARLGVVEGWRHAFESGLFRAQENANLLLSPSRQLD